ncbi:MAG: hypothetical protein O3B97_01435 [Actinomycetota bacterium]|nr:hypothetical protein [Actinomycetota bacterium]
MNHIPFPFFEQDDSDRVACASCGWAGEAGDLAIDDVSTEHMRYHQLCPACLELVRVVAFPTHAQVRAARRRGDPRADDLGPMAG